MRSGTKLLLDVACDNRLYWVPPGLSPEFAAQLRKVAWQVVQENSPAGKAENAQQKPPGQ